MTRPESPTTEREQRFNDVLAEYLEGLEAGQADDRAALLARHADLADELRAFFAHQDQVQELAMPLRQTVAPRASAEAYWPALPAEQFRIVREVGRGGMGVVYEAVEPSLGRRVALKVLRTHDQSDPRALQRFVREARVVARLHHTNIVPIFQVGAHEGLHYFAMEFIDGRGLDKVLHELRHAPTTAGAHIDGTQPLSGAAEAAPPSAAAETGPAVAEVGMRMDAPSAAGPTATRCQLVARIGVQVAEALAHAHEHGVLHRDIKPANLLLDRNGAVWVSDFGLAKEGDQQLTDPGEVVGTLRYLAPERFSGQVDARGDVYSLGATLYELLTLRPIYDEADRAKLMARVLHDEPIRPRHLDKYIPRDLETIVLKALAKEPAQRYQTAQALADDLRRFLDDVPIQARRATVFERGWRWCRRNPGVAAASVAAVTALVVGLGVALWQWQRADENAQQAEASAAQANKDFQLALQAIEQMLERLGGDRLVPVPHMDRTRRALLQDAVRLYRDLLRSKDAHPEVRLALARAYCHLGKVHTLLDEWREAVQQQNQALTLVGELGDADATDLERRHLMATIHLCRGWAKDGLQQHDGAEADFRQAHSIWESLTVERPDRPEFAGGKAYSLLLLGNLLRWTSRPEEAEPLLRQTVAVAEKLPPTYHERAGLLASGLNALGLVLKADGRPAQAEAMCRRALELRERTDRERPEPANRHDLAVALHHLAQLRARDPKAQAEAEKLYARSVELSERLVADFPGQAIYRNPLAEATNDFGLLLSRLGRPKEAEARFERSLAVCRLRVARSPGAARYRVELGAALNNLAEEQGMRGDLACARKLLEEAIGIQQSVLKTDPREPRALEFLANHYGTLAKVLMKSGKFPDAEQAVMRHRAAAQDLMDKDPRSVGVRVFQALAAENLALLRSGAKRLDDAAAAYAEAAKVRRALTVDFPADPAYASQLGVILNNWANLYRQQRRWAEMVPLLDEAIQLQEKAARSRPEERRYQQFVYNHYTLRAGAGVELGDHARVVAIAAALRERFPDHLDDRLDEYFWAARVARCIPLAKKDADLSPEKRDELARQYADETMTLLRLAQQKKSKYLPQIHTNLVFQPFRNRADFQELLATVKKPAKSGK